MARDPDDAAVPAAAESGGPDPLWLVGRRRRGSGGRAPPRHRARLPGQRHSFLPQRDVIEHVTASSLAEALESAQSAGDSIAVLHLLCHGGASGQNFGLMLDGQDADPHVVDAGQLRRILAPHAGMVRLVVLAACNSADSGAVGNQLGSVAQALHRAGIAQVVASRYPLTIAGSIRLAEVLYPSLLSGSGSLEAALLKARDSLARQDTHLDWVSLQFFARASDGEFQRASYLLGDSLRQPAARPPRAARTLAALSLGGLLILGAAVAGSWHVMTAPQPAARPPLALAPIAALPLAAPPQPLARPEVNPVSARAETPASIPTPSPLGTLAGKSDRHTPEGPPSTMPIYRGVLLFGISPMKGAKLTLIGTDCTAHTDADGVFSFKSCRDRDGVSRLTRPSVIVHLPGNEVGPLSCAGKVIGIEKPPAITRIDFREHCATQEGMSGAPVPRSP